MEYSDFLKLATSSIKGRIYVGQDSFSTYKEYVYKIIVQYNLTESELFVMFMMLTKNYDEIQQCASAGVKVRSSPKNVFAYLTLSSVKYREQITTCFIELTNISE